MNISPRTIVTIAALSTALPMLAPMPVAVAADKGQAVAVAAEACQKARDPLSPGPPLFA